MAYIVQVELQFAKVNVSKAGQRYKQIAWNKAGFVKLE